MLHSVQWHSGKVETLTLQKGLVIERSTRQQLGEDVRWEKGGRIACIAPVNLSMLNGPIKIMKAWTLVYEIPLDALDN